MDGTVELIFGKIEEDGSISELGRADPEDGVDAIAEIPGYAAAIRRGTNCSFLSTDEEMVKRLRVPVPKETGAERRADAGDGPVAETPHGEHEDKGGRAGAKGKGKEKDEG